MAGRSASEKPDRSRPSGWGGLTAAHFAPAWWCPGPHAQTLWPALLRRRPRPPWRRQRLELEDGDFLDVDWCGAEGADAPTVIVLHGLEGNSDSHYVRGLTARLVLRGWRVAVLHFRGCSGEPNRLATGYHACASGDLAWFLERLDEGRPLAAVGYSLGGAVLLRWLGHCGRMPALVTAVAASVPFRLDLAARRLECGFSRMYQRSLLAKMKRSVRRKAALLAGVVDLERAAAAASFTAFDDAVTAPLHGFADAADYYRRCSSRACLARIEVPTLIVHARDDPFTTPESVPTAGELSDNVRLELSPSGGHVGFIAGRLPGVPRYWLEKRIVAHLAAALA